MSFIGEAALSAFFDLLLKRLSSSSLNYVADYKEVHKQLKEWQKKLPEIQTVLNDAEQKQITDEGVKNWLADLQDLAYDVDDILDEFAYEALRLKLQNTRAKASTSKVRKLIPTCCFSKFSPASIKFNHAMISEIKKMTDRLNKLETRRTTLGLSKIISKGPVKMKARLQGCLPNENFDYVGRDGEKKEIVELLKSGDGTKYGVFVITIVGAGGMGKTTLAQLVYNDPAIKDSFDLTAWVTVSDDFDAIRITKSILEFISSEPCNGNDLSSLQVKLKDKLSGKRFLLILDDLWSESYDDWIMLASPFGVGTKIIVTTRLQKVSAIVGAEKEFLLSKLSDNHCLSIFTQHALGATDFEKYPELKEAGETIVRKCCGLPLAAKAIGGLLRPTRDPDEWEKNSRSEIWELPQDKCSVIPALRLSYSVIPALRLSYLHLPPHLKRCFAYCSIFPKDYDFDKEELIMLWKAEGLLEKKTDIPIKDFGNECFQELISRSFFQKSGENQYRFVMHDLINDLAQSVAGEICFKLGNDKQQRASNRTRHLSYFSNKYDGVKTFEALGEVRSLRTFLQLKTTWVPEFFLTSFVFDDLLSEFKCLRVLSLKGYRISKLPDLFEKLKHLRHLDCSHTAIKCLPDSLCTLYQLETLLLKGCKELERLPSEIGNLIELHCLNITGAESMKTMPSGIGKLANLESLSKFILGEGNGDLIGELGNLSDLRGDFCLSGLENIVKHQDAREAKLFEKSGIRRLELQWSQIVSNDARRKKEIEEQVLEFLHPSQKKLEHLIINNYGGARFPSWIADSSFERLWSLELRNCKLCKTLPSIGKLPVLKHLVISGFDEVVKVGVELFGENHPNAFACLENLSFRDMPNWREWVPCGGDEQFSKFPKLRELSISNCPQLSGMLPTCLPSLKELFIYCCRRLVVSISSFPSLCELDIDDCEEIVDECSTKDGNSLQNVSLSNVSKLSIPTERMASRFANLKFFKISNFGEMASLSQMGFRLLGHHCIYIGNCHQLESLETEEMEEQKLHSTGIQILLIRECERLNRLPKVLHSLKFLVEIEISQCSSLISFGENKLPPTLSQLAIYGCDNLQYLAYESKCQSASSHTCCLLKNLTISGCGSLGCISSSADTVSHLQRLSISNCRKLTSLFLKGNLPTSLKKLQIEDCERLECIARDFHVTTSLETIIIYGCNNIKYLPPEVFKLTNLQKISIELCLNLDFNFEKSGLPQLTNLRYFTATGCPYFRALPHCINSYTSLQSLSVGNYVGDISFPEDGFPTNLTTLCIENAPKLYRSLVEWGLHKLASLQVLEVTGEGCSDVVSFPEKDMMLPPTLTCIIIRKFEDLEFMHSEGFQNLTSLRELQIWNCFKLRALPEKNVLLSLEQLRVWGCPRVSEYMEKGKGGMWSHIGHIPCVCLDYKMIIPLICRN